MAVSNISTLRLRVGALIQRAAQLCRTREACSQSKVGRRHLRRIGVLPAYSTNRSLKDICRLRVDPNMHLLSDLATLRIFPDADSLRRKRVIAVRQDNVVPEYPRLCRPWLDKCGTPATAACEPSRLAIPRSSSQLLLLIVIADTGVCLA